VTVHVPAVPLTCEPSKQVSAGAEVANNESQISVSHVAGEIAAVKDNNDEDSESHDSETTQPEESPQKSFDHPELLTDRFQTSPGGFLKPETSIKADSDAPTKSESNAPTKFESNAPTNSDSGTATTTAEVKLSEDQQRAFNAVMAGENVLITGEAGTGKSFLVDHLVNNLVHKKVQITASTGVAACNISGGTLHSFAGIGLGKGTKEDLLYKVQSWKAAKNRWTECEVLIVDEISMIDADLFEKLDYVAKNVRSAEAYSEHLRQLPFGGLQLIFVGDFLQLPPVTKSRSPKFAFQSSKWKQTIPETIQLRQIFRQKDSSFKRLLQKVRRGECPEDVYQTLTSRLTGNNVVPPGQTQLLTHRANVDTMNLKLLGEIDKPVVEFYAADIQGRNNPDYKNFAKNCTGKELLEVKEGARVMLLKNIHTKAGLVNGALGTLVGFEPLDEMSYQSNVEGHSKFFEDVSEKRLFPRVHFDCGIEATIGPHGWEYKKDGKVRIARLQVPLMLAWAITIHKSQGMTLSSAYVSLNSCFANGQVYVALSRLQSLEGLHILGKTFNKGSIKAADACLDFYGIPRSKAAHSSRKNIPKGKFASIAGNFRKKMGKKANAGTPPQFKTSLKPRFGSKSPAPVGGKKKFGLRKVTKPPKKFTPTEKSEPTDTTGNGLGTTSNTFGTALPPKPAVAKKPSPSFGNTQKKSNPLKFKRKSPISLVKLKTKTTEAIRLEKECDEWLENLKSKCNGKPQKLKAIIGMMKMKHKGM